MPDAASIDFDGDFDGDTEFERLFDGNVARLETLANTKVEINVRTI